MSLPRFPATRFQGSKRKILPEIAALLEREKCQTIVDLYSGSGIVSLLFRHLGKTVHANDYLQYNSNTAALFLNYESADIKSLSPEQDLEFLLNNSLPHHETVISTEFSSIYFNDDENRQIDAFCQNINAYSGIKKSIYIYAVGQALIKKRPYNLFHRANLSMRLKEVKRSFGNAKTWETSIKAHALKCIKELSTVPLPAATGHVTTCVDTSDIAKIPKNYDVVYMDPPYLNGKSIAVNYSDFYHFLEGLCDYDLFKSGNSRYPHKPIVNKHSAWHKADSACEEIQSICKHFSSSTIIMSYRSDGVPTPDQIQALMESCGRQVEIHSAGEYKYALSTTEESEEIFVIARP